MSSHEATSNPFTAYQYGEITSPATAVLGAVSAGRGSARKTLCVQRPPISVTSQVVVMDGEDQNGEYAALARTLGATLLHVGGGAATVLNPLELCGLDDAGREKATS